MYGWQRRFSPFKTRMNIPPSPFKTQPRVTRVSWQQLDWREPEVIATSMRKKKKFQDHPEP
jgi:hypothetical protein